MTPVAEGPVAAQPSPADTLEKARQQVDVPAPAWSPTDGTTCRVEGMLARAGLVRIDFHNRSSAPASILGAGVREPKTWAKALDYIGALDLSGGEPVIPDWLVPVEGTGGSAEAGKDGTGLATLPAGLVGLACPYGDWPDLQFVDGGSFKLAE